MTDRQKELIRKLHMDEAEFEPDPEKQPDAMRERINELEDALNALISGETDDDG